MKNKLFSISMLLLASCCLLPNADAVEQAGDKSTTIESVELGTNFFQAIDGGLIDVTFIAPNAQHANVLIQNNTNRVLHVKLPDAFAAVPILAQFDRGGQNLGQGMGGPGGGGGPQGVGGGFNAGQQGGFGQQQGRGQGQQGMQFGGMMRIPPEKVRKLKATTVCLEHGKPEPNARLKYQIIPIEQFSKDVRVAELCKQLGRGDIKQNTAQAIAWHLANEKTWDQLAKINRLQSRYLGNVTFFTPAELQKAQSIVAELGNRTEDSTATNY